MHVPDGFLDLPTSVATGVVSAGAVAVALRAARTQLDDRWPIRAGLTAAFVFAAQLVNFPVGAGTSGHLIGAALATALLGPAAALVVMTCVLGVQALVFADGGLTALGTNVLLMGVTAVLVAHGVQTLALAAMRGRRAAVPWAAALAAGASVPAAALLFCGLYAVGGAVPVPPATLTATMLGVHAVIGVGEAVITGLCVASILALRPDLVALAGPQPAASGRRRLGRAVGWVVLAATVVVAGALSLVASTSPDGLEWSAEVLGFGEAALPSAVGGSPLADYAWPGLEGWGTSVAGLLGVGLVLAAATGLAALVRRRQPA